MSERSNIVAGVRLSNPDRVLFPEQGLTKLDLAEYYAEIGDWILPYLVDRPLTLVRCPRGRTQQCFYQKHVTESIPDNIEAIEVQEKDGTGLYVSINDLEGLISLVQLGVLEFHPWGSRQDHLDRPDRIIFDLDPGPEVTWRSVVDGAKELRERLSGLGLTSFLRTTGGKGFHVVVPIVRRVGWEEVKSFARAIADAMVHDHPRKYIATSSKARRHGKIYVDYLRNDHGATAIASYSTRARIGATVSTPIGWDELSPRLNPTHFNTHSVPQRLSSLRHDPWAGFFDTRQSLTRAMMSAVAAQ